MPKSVQYVALISTTLLYALGFAHAANETNTPSPTSLSPSIASSAVSVGELHATSTCQSRTINYITHTLPQQCAKSRTSLRDSETAQAADNGAKGVIETSLPGELSPQVTSTEIGGHLGPGDAVTGTATVAGEAPSASNEQVTTKALTSTSTATSSTASPEPEADNESPLDNANFLSFEEWKKQNLAKAGQSPDSVGQGRSTGTEGRRRPVSINHALDSLGEDAEIELDFGGFGSAGKMEESVPSRASDKAAYSEKGDNKATETPAASPRARSKDAGKTCKERFNYASFDCAATVLKTNPQCKSSSSVLVENKDSYMLNECAAPNKFLIVELCDDILVDTVVLANFEFFSSMFRTFRVSVSDRYPVKADRWKELGVFEARNSRDIQAFLVENPLIWARYLRVEFLTHYGNEYYCPLSLLRVHGTTMMEEFRHQEEIARGEDDQEEGEIDELEGEVVHAVSHAVFTTSDAADLSNKTEPKVDSGNQELSSSSEGFAQASESATVEPAQPSPAVGEILQAIKEEPGNTTTPQEPAAATGDETVVPTPAPQEISTATTTKAVTAASASLDTKDSNLTLTISNTPLSTPPVASNLSVFSNETSVAGSETSKANDKPVSTSLAPTAASNSTTSLSSVLSSNASQPSSSGSEAKKSSPETSSASTTAATSNATEPKAPAPKPPSTSTSTSNASKASSTRPDGTRAASSSTKPPPPNPTTQESFFKSIHKRLQMLEANSTLSLQYIEEQSRILRDAFTKVEKRQLSKTSTFLAHLNTTVLAELTRFRTQYDQLWQSTVLELENHREAHQREMRAISSRLTLLTDELVYQKRVSVVQTTLVLLCLGLLLFVRAGTAGGLEFPLVQGMVGKSQGAVRVDGESPSPPGSPEPRSAYQSARKRFRMFRSSSSGHRSDDSAADGRRSPVLEFSPPTPTSDAEEGEGAGALPLQMPKEAMRETQSGPATPRGTRDSPPIPSWSGDEVGEVVNRLKPGPGDAGGVNGVRRRSPLRSDESAGYGSEGSAGDEVGGELEAKILSS